MTAKILAFLLLLLLALPSEAQYVRGIDGDEIALALPPEAVTYSRDAVALRDEMWALDNIQLAFWLDSLSGNPVQFIPEFQSEASRQFNDSLLIELGQLDAELTRIEGLLADKDATIVSLEAQIAPLEQRNAELEELISLARQSVGQFIQRLKTFD